MWKVRTCKLNMNIQRIQLMFSTNIERREAAWEVVKSGYMSACQKNVCNPKRRAIRSDPQLMEIGLPFPNLAQISWIPDPFLPVFSWKIYLHIYFNSLHLVTKSKPLQPSPCLFRKLHPVRDTQGPWELSKNCVPHDFEYNIKKQTGERDVEWG